MYKAYLEEREGKSLIYTDKGYATYLIVDNEIYLEDIYVKPEFRQTREAWKMADQIAEIGKESGCKYMSGSVVPSAPGATRNMKMMISYGFDLAFAKDNFIGFIKEI